MPSKSTCNVCRSEISNPEERVPRVYRVRATRAILPSQFKHNACNDRYAAERPGLEAVLPTALGADGE